MSAHECGNQILVGKVAAWCHLDECEHQPGRMSGHGEVVATLADPLILVRVTSDDDEPPYMIVLSVGDPTLHFHDDERSYTRWVEWLFQPESDKQPNAKSSAQRH